MRKGIVAMVRPGIYATLLMLCATWQAEAKDRIKLVCSVAADIVVLRPEDWVGSDARAVKAVTLGGSTNSPECSYFEIVEKAKQLAVASGANIVKIERHDQANGETCDRVKATLYKSEQVQSCEKEFSWSKDRKLIWSDFRGIIPKFASDVTAATISCEIGFETSSVSSDNDDLKIHVYNKFSKNESWSRREDQNAEVLNHEQGHFDLCELFTRKLRERLSNLSFNMNTMKGALRSVYDQTLADYRATQELYEAETHHGVNPQQQARWDRFLTQELAQSEPWMERSAITAAR
jgi:hypothetical protein